MTAQAARPDACNPGSFVFSHDPLVLAISPSPEMIMRIKPIPIETYRRGRDWFDLDRGSVRPLIHRCMTAPALHIGELNVKKNRILRPAKMLDLSQRR